MSQLYAVRTNSINVDGPLAGAGGRVVRSDQAATADALTELFRTLAEVLDIRRVFSRVSEIVSDVLPHDCLELLSLDGANHFTLAARSIDAFPEFRRLALAGDAPFHIVSDLVSTPPRLSVCDPPDFLERITAAGYRSMLVVKSRARYQEIALAFFAKREEAFTFHDLPTARHIAECVGLAIAHEQLATAEREGAETRVRAARLDVKVQQVSDGPSRKSERYQTIGQSAGWKKVLKQATQVALTEATVFLQGETGTGKEVIARFIHRTSARRAGPFIAINCAALPEHLLESELFGYERGAFTGAQHPKPGQIELAAGGVLFLDEVSEMSPTAQAKLLRVLQEREFLRLGGTRLLKANVRVIAATNRDLRQAVGRGTLREDLYYRLQVFDIRIPPLRERASDIPLFISAFLDDIRSSSGGSAAGVTPEAKQMLVAHSWPGNVRELRNVVERAAILCDGGPIAPQHLALNPAFITPLSPTTNLPAAERRAIEQVLRETDGNKAKAARRLGLTRTQLYVRLRKHRLEGLAAS
jgi:transcriptional regulator with GAF, ATPase, and Fis domain